MGSTIEVTWTGPDYRDDYIGIGLVDAEGGAQWENWTYTRDGSPTKLLVPATPGEYLIRYFVRQDRSAIAEIPLTVTPVTATLTAPETATAGSTIQIGWTGPDYKEDYIGVGLVGASGGAQWQSWAYTRDGSPVTITLPDTPGDYVVQYFIRQDRDGITSLPIKVE